MLEYLSTLEFLKGARISILGLVLAGIFVLFKFEPPAPHNLYRVLGVSGIFLGWVVIKSLMQKHIVKN